MQLKSEFLKLIYNRWILLVSCVVPVFAVVLIKVLNVDSSGTDLYMNKWLQSIYLTQDLFVVIAALFMGEENLRSTLRTGLTGTPARVKFLACKTGCLLVWITILLTITTLACAVYVGTCCGFEIGMIKTIMPAYLSLLELTLMAAGLTVIIRSQTISMAIVVALLMGIGQMLMSLGPAMRFIPVQSVMNAFYTFGSPALLSIGTGLLCQGVWTAIVVLTAFVIFDVRAVR